MRTRPNRLGMYADVRDVLDAALRSNGGTFICATHGAAVHWRHRCYRFRKLYADTVSADSPYDRLTFPKIPPESSTVVINIIASPGIFVPSDPSAVVPGHEEADDELLKAALDLMKDLP